MDKIVYLSVAGSGKTYDLCHRINEQKRNIIIAFTNQNIENIRREIFDRLGYIPDNTEILTFHSFIYRDFLMPFEYIVWDKFKRKRFNKRVRTKGISLLEPPKSSLVVDKKVVNNPRYIKDKYIEHYIDIDTKKYYCSRISKLIKKCKIRDGIILKAIERLELYYDNLYIDEFQDFRKYDYKLLNDIIKRSKLNCYLYGDFYQHSVSGVNNYGPPFKKGNKYISYKEFVDELEQNGYVVDNKKLKRSRRCSSDVCKYIREKLDIKIYSCSDNEGKVKHIKCEEDIKRIIENDNIIKLFYNNANKQLCKSINWGYSKGDTYDEICVIKTKKLNLDSKITRNKYYVALTRSKGDVYLIDKDQYDNYLNNRYKL